MNSWDPKGPLPLLWQSVDGPNLGLILHRQSQLQWAWGATTLSEDPSLVLRTHVGWLTTICNPSSWESKASVSTCNYKHILTPRHPATQTHITNLVKSSTKVMSCLEFSIPHHPPPWLFHSSSLFFCDILWALLGNVQTFCLWLGMRWLFIINYFGSLWIFGPIIDHDKRLLRTKLISALTYGHTQLFRGQLSRYIKSI